LSIGYARAHEFPAEIDGKPAKSEVKRRRKKGSDECRLERDHLLQGKELAAILIGRVTIRNLRAGVSGKGYPDAHWSRATICGVYFVMMVRSSVARRIKFLNGRWCKELAEDEGVSLGRREILECKAEVENVLCVWATCRKVVHHIIGTRAAREGHGAGI
jgi:hypothetical protein